MLWLWLLLLSHYLEKKHMMDKKAIKILNFFKASNWNVTTSNEYCWIFLDWGWFKMATSRRLHSTTFLVIFLVWASVLESWGQHCGKTAYGSKRTD